MNHAEISRYLNRAALLTVGALAVPVTVTDARSVFGRVDLQVTPVGGSGQTWVALERVALAVAA